MGQGKATDADADFEPPSKEEVNDMLQQTIKLRKQRAAARKAKEDEDAMTCETCNATLTEGVKDASTGKVKMTAEARAAKKAEREKRRQAKKDEMEMMRNLQAVQGTALKEEMAKGGKKTIVQEQSYGDTYMKTAVLSTASIGEQMST